MGCWAASVGHLGGIGEACGGIRRHLEAFEKHLGALGGSSELTGLWLAGLGQLGPGWPAGYGLGEQRHWTTTKMCFLYLGGGPAGFGKQMYVYCVFWHHISKQKTSVL